MRILLWSPNYAPELTGIPPLVTDAAEWLAARGHSVDVVTAVPNYPQRRIHDEYAGVLWRSEDRNGVRVHRSWLRATRETSLLDKALYELSISTFALPNASRIAGRVDVILCVVPTLLAGLYGAVLARVLRKPLVLWIQDLVLHAGAAVVGPGGARLLAGAAGLERWLYRRADGLIVCSPGFREHLAGAGVDDDRVHTIYNWADTDTIRPCEPKENRPPRFLYAGNLGHTQGFETLLEAARLGGNSLAVDIVGAGNEALRVERLAASVANVTVRGPVAAAEYPGVLAAADVHIVLQRKVAAGANLPSKISSSLASGRPIVGSLRQDTPAARLLEESGAAVVVPAESPHLLAEAMLQLAGDPSRRAQLGRSGRAYAELHLSREPALARLESVLDAAVRKRD